MNRDWFEMNAIRRRRVENAVWVPLRQSESTKKGEHGFEGYQEEFSGAGSVMVPTNLRDEGRNLGWGDIGLIHNQGPWASEENYKPTDIYQVRTGEDLGVELALVQSFDGAAPAIWHLNQDLVFALSLLREGDSWVRPDEDFLEVARLKRNEDGRPVLLEIRAEHLRDYLAARRMALRIARFQSRECIVSSIEDLGWEEGAHTENDDAAETRFEIHITKIHEGGEPFGAKTAVFHAARNDVDPEEDVPIMGPEKAGNVDHAS